MEPKGLFWTTFIAGVLGTAVLLLVVSHMDDRRANRAPAQTDSICLTCDSRP
jgi:hypothetical protein